MYNFNIVHPQAQPTQQFPVDAASQMQVIVVFFFCNFLRRMPMVVLNKRNQDIGNFNFNVVYPIVNVFGNAKTRVQFVGISLPIPFGLPFFFNPNNGDHLFDVEKNNALFFLVIAAYIIVVAVEEQFNRNQFDLLVFKLCIIPVSSLMILETPMRLPVAMAF